MLVVAWYLADSTEISGIDLDDFSFRKRVFMLEGFV